MRNRNSRRRGCSTTPGSGTADRTVAAAESQKTERMLKAWGTPVEVFLYEGADHGFLAYTRPSYKPDAAKLAWARTVQFLHNHLK